MLLGRNAGSLFWMARYVERAEKVARVIDVNLHLMLDTERWIKNRVSFNESSDDPLFSLVGTFPFPSSDHRLVWIDVTVPGR